MLVSDYTLKNRVINHSFHRGHYPQPGSFHCEVNGDLLAVEITWHGYCPPAYCPVCGKYLLPDTENLYIHN